jgi:hypothetical protein
VKILEPTKFDLHAAQSYFTRFGMLKQFKPIDKQVHVEYDVAECDGYESAKKALVDKEELCRGGVCTVDLEPGKEFTFK